MKTPKLFRFLVFVSIFVTGSVSVFAEGKPLGTPLDKLGLYYDLEDGAKANLRIEDGHFRVYFINEKGEVIEPLYNRAILNGKSIRGNRERETYVLQPNGSFLEDSEVLRPPYVYRLSLVLANSKEKEEAADSGAQFELSRDAYGTAADDGGSTMTDKLVFPMQMLNQQGASGEPEPAAEVPVTEQPAFDGDL